MISVAQFRMFLDQAELCLAQAPGLGKQLSGDANFAQVVNVGGQHEAVRAIR